MTGRRLPQKSAPVRCIACAQPMVTGQGYLPDESGGVIHASCLGPERESYTRNGKPLGPNDPIPTPHIWNYDHD